MSVSTNKIYLEHSHAHLSIYCLWLLCALIAEKSVCKRLYGPQNKIFIWPLRKS